jgi:hypothetical protein
MVAPGHLLSSSLRGSEWLSGGTVGPEGSVLCFVVIAGLWIAFDRIYPKAVRVDHAMVPMTATASPSSIISPE